MTASKLTIEMKKKTFKERGSCCQLLDHHRKNKWRSRTMEWNVENEMDDELSASGALYRLEWR